MREQRRAEQTGQNGQIDFVALQVVRCISRLSGSGMAERRDPSPRPGCGLITDQALSLAAIASSLASIERISARSSSVGIGILAMFTFTAAGWFHPCSCAALLTTSLSLAATYTTSSPSHSARLTLAFRVA